MQKRSLALRIVNRFRIPSGMDNVVTSSMSLGSLSPPATFNATTLNLYVVLAASPVTCKVNDKGLRVNNVKGKWS